MLKTIKETDDVFEPLSNGKKGTTGQINRLTGKYFSKDFVRELRLETKDEKELLGVLKGYVELYKESKKRKTRVEKVLEMVGNKYD